MSLSQELAVPCLTTAHQGPLFPVEEVILDNFAKIDQLIYGMLGIKLRQ